MRVCQSGPLSRKKVAISGSSRTVTGIFSLWVPVEAYWVTVSAVSQDPWGRFWNNPIALYWHRRPRTLVP